MFERFTEQSIRVIMYAQEESRQLGHRHVGTDHLLLGLLRVEPGIASRSLIELGVNLSTLRTEVERLRAEGETNSIQEIPFDGECKLALERSWNEARKFDHKYIGTQHLLLGLLRNRLGVSTLATRILESFEVNIDLLISKVEEKMVLETNSDGSSRLISGDSSDSATVPASKSAQSTEKTYYRRLQVDRKAEAGLIAEVYHYLSEKYHPDRPGTGDKETYELIEHAWAVLGDQDKRQEYDATLG